MPTLLVEVEVPQSQTGEMLVSVHDQTLGESPKTESMDNKFMRFRLKKLNMFSESVIKSM